MVTVKSERRVERIEREYEVEFYMTKSEFDAIGDIDEQIIAKTNTPGMALPEGFEIMHQVVGYYHWSGDCRTSQNGTFKATVSVVAVRETK